jgi:hypothetical protein
MATGQVTYSGTPTTITMDLAGLTSDTNLLNGRESAEIDNTTNRYIDCMVEGFVSVGTTPTVGTQIFVYVWGSGTAASSTALDGIGGTDSAANMSNAAARNSTLYLAQTITLTANTSDFAYPVRTFSVAQLFGYVPRYWGLYVVHNTVAALRNNAANTNSFKFVGIKADIA